MCRKTRVIASSTSLRLRPATLQTHYAGGWNVGPRTPSGTGADSIQHGRRRVAVAPATPADALQWRGDAIASDAGPNGHPSPDREVAGTRSRGTQQNAHRVRDGRSFALVVRPQADRGWPAG